jgi:hypothetical protein
VSDFPVWSINESPNPKTRNPMKLKNTGRNIASGTKLVDLEVYKTIVNAKNSTAPPNARSIAPTNPSFAIAEPCCLFLLTLLKRFIVKVRITSF